MKLFEEELLLQIECGGHVNSGLVRGFWYMLRDGRSFGRADIFRDAKSRVRLEDPSLASAQAKNKPTGVDPGVARQPKMPIVSGQAEYCVSRRGGCSFASAVRSESPSISHSKIGFNIHWLLLLSFCFKYQSRALNQTFHRLGQLLVLTPKSIGCSHNDFCLKQQLLLMPYLLVLVQS